MVIFHSYVSLPEGILSEVLLLNTIASVTNVEETAVFFGILHVFYTLHRHASCYIWGGLGWGKNVSVRYVIKAGTLTLDICWDN